VVRVHAETPLADDGGLVTAAVVAAAGGDVVLLSHGVDGGVVREVGDGRRKPRSSCAVRYWVGLPEPHLEFIIRICK